MKYEDLNYDLLIPGQHNEIANALLAYVGERFELPEPARIKIATELARAKYWEAYDCQDESRQEYWRVVLICFDSYHKPTP